MRALLLNLHFFNSLKNTTLPWVKISKVSPASVLCIHANGQVRAGSVEPGKEPGLEKQDTQEMWTVGGVEGSS